MKKMKIRIISLLLAVVMLACLIPPVDMTAQASVTGYDIVSYARQYIGYPYKLGMTGPKAFDCAGFVHYVYKHFGIELPTNASTYFNNPTKYGTLIDKGSIEKAQMGDVIAWEGHVAIYTEDGYCVEALGTQYGVLDSIKVNRHTNGMNYKVIRIKGVLPEGTPLISSLSATNSGVEIKWDKIANAENYRVYRKGTDGKWVKLADTASVSYLDKTAVSGKTYTYTVRGVSKDGNSFTSDYDKDGKSIKFLTNPKLSSVSNVENGVNISWAGVSGAEKYRVYYKTAAGDWTKIGDTTGTSYTWTGAKSGTNYVFTVRCINSAGTAYASGFDPVGKSIKYIAAPKITSVVNGLYGVQITWGAVAGAEKYRVFYRIGSGAWTKIVDTAATTYAWLSPVGGTNYIFTVRCINSNGTAYTSYFDTAGRSNKYIATPKITSVSTRSAAIQIDWGKVSGAALYRVYYKTPSTGWTKIGDTTGTSYIWTGAKGGTDYTFTVRCLTSDGKSHASGYDPVGKSIKYIETPKITSVVNGLYGVQITWGAVSGAQKYRVFYRTGSGAWTKIADTTATTYAWLSPVGGTNYTFTVRCINSNGTVYTSGFDSVGKSIKFIATPKITSVSTLSAAIQIDWGKVSGAALYRVYYKTPSTGWTKIGDTTGASYIWTGAQSGTDYTFTVRCITSDGKSHASGYDPVGKSIKYIETPKITSVVNGLYGVQITWGAVSGAQKYRVFYRTGSGAWTKIADTTETTYAWLSPVGGTNYTFTVRCVNSDGTVYTSGFDSVGKSIKFIAAPKISSVANVESGIAISWGSVSGAEKYRLYYKTASIGWTKIDDTAATSYTWTGAQSGTDYTFTVRCITSDGKSYTSGFYPIGEAIAYK